MPKVSRFSLDSETLRPFFIISKERVDKKKNEKKNL